MRSNILEPNENGIKEVVDQQFEVGKQILAAGLMPIIEPEVNVYSDNKEKSEQILKEEIEKHLDQLTDDQFPSRERTKCNIMMYSNCNKIFK